MNRYLFFRTDRVGDFLLSAILFKSIKRNDKNSHITLICSEKNFEFIKYNQLVDEVKLYKKNDFFYKFFFFLRNIFKKYKLIGALDGKKRSIYFTILNFSKIKILTTNKSFYKKTLSLFLNNILLDKNFKTKLEETKYILSILNFDIIEEDFNTLKFQNFKKNFINKRYNIFHLDEKWIHKKYIRNYINIEPNLNDLISFLNLIVNKTNKTLIVTTGFESNHLIDDLKIKNNNNSILIFNKLNIFDLQNLICFSDTLISCHGAPTHIAGAFNKQIIDIIDLSEKEFFDKWSAHFRNHKSISRDNFDILSSKILQNL